MQLMGKAPRPTRMGAGTEVATFWARRVDLEASIGCMARSSVDNLRTTSSTERAATIGVMGEPTLANGKRTSSMDMGGCLGLMVRFMRAIMTLERKTEKALSSGPTVVASQASGETAS